MQVIEIKTRTKKYETWYVSLNKVMKGMEFRRAGVRPFFAVSWPDGIFQIELINPPKDIRLGGRKDRGDWQDMEPVAHFPVADFRRVG